MSLYKSSPANIAIISFCRIPSKPMKKPKLYWSLRDRQNISESAPDCCLGKEPLKEWVKLSKLIHTKTHRIDRLDSEFNFIRFFKSHFLVCLFVYEGIPLYFMSYTVSVIKFIHRIAWALFWACFNIHVGISSP